MFNVSVHRVFARTLCVVVIPTRSSASTSCRQVGRLAPTALLPAHHEAEQGRVRPCRFVRHDHFTAGVKRFYYAEVFSSPSAHELPDGDNIPVGVERSCHAEVLFQQFSACGILVAPLQSNMECDVYIRKELYAISCCLVARPCSNGFERRRNSCAEVLSQPGSLAAESTTRPSRSPRCVTLTSASTNMSSEALSAKRRN